MMHPSVDKQPVSTLNPTVLYHVTREMAALKKQEYDPFFSPHRMKKFMKWNMTDFRTIMVYLRPS